jgi:hypothetical protein
MNVDNVTIDGPAAGLAVPTDCTLLLFGILFGPPPGTPGVGATGTVNNVHVNDVFQKPTSAFGSCQVGVAIRADGYAAPMQKVTITNTTVTGYQKGGVIGSGAFMTLDMSNSTIGPPAPLEGFIAQNGLQYGGGGTNAGTGGITSNSTIWGSGDQTAGPGGGTPLDTGTAVLFYAAKDATVTHNTMTGPKTDFGVSVASATDGAPSTGVVVSFNDITRTAPDTPNNFGHGIDIDPSQATLICNTFSGWNANIVGGIQVSCSLPAGTECQAYSAQLTVEGGTAPFDWSASGTLPPGLGLASDGKISGIPIQPGTFDFTAHVTDSSSPPLTATQAQSIHINADPTCDPEEVGENPAIPEADEPGEAPVAPITTTGLAFTG